jgi:hypothetical protein
MNKISKYAQLSDFQNKSFDFRATEAEFPPHDAARYAIAVRLMSSNITNKAR